jgi:copper(I)-binding protein
MTIKTFIGAAALALTALTAQAHEYKLGAIAIGHPYARATAAGQPNGGAFLGLANAGADDRLLSVSATVANSVELHQMSMDGNVMRMRQVDGIELKTGKPVALEPGGYHVMLLGLHAPLKSGDSFPMTLKFEKAGSVVVEVKVEGADATHSGAMADMKH